MTAAKPRAELLGLHDIAHDYGRLTAVDGVDLSVLPHEMVCLLGPSGCGKSTLLRIAAGLERPSRGRVSIDGRIVAGPGVWLPPERRHIGLVFQEPSLFPHLSVAENVRFGLNGLAPAVAEARVRDWLAQLGLRGSADAYPHTLSGGEQQRVALARAMAPAPRIMLLDEPFSSLDARLREQIRDDALHVLKRSGTATLMVTHDPEEAMFMADRIALMRAGRIEQFATPADLYCRPQNAFVATFFGPTNQLHGQVRGGSVDTPLGPVRAGKLAEGSEVCVVIRQEAVKVDAAALPPQGAGVRGQVVLSRLLGRHSLIHLRVDDAHRHYHIHARMPGVFLPAPGTSLGLALDTSQVFVFPSTAS